METEKQKKIHAHAGAIAKLPCKKTRTISFQRENILKY